MPDQVLTKGWLCHLGACGGLLGTGLLKRQVCLEGCGPRPFLLPISGVFGTRGSTQLFLKLKVFMFKIKQLI